MKLRIGQGIDIHPFCKGRALVLGGVEIPHEYGLDGHSDADALLHAIIDALLGAAGQGDIGVHFPNTDPKWKGISSLELLKIAWDGLAKSGWKIVNIDSSLLLEKPKIVSYIPEMKKKIAETLQIDTSCIGIKATTSEKLGFVGRQEGVLAQAVALLSD